MIFSKKENSTKRVFELLDVEILENIDKTIPFLNKIFTKDSEKDILEIARTFFIMKFARNLFNNLLKQTVESPEHEIYPIYLEVKRELIAFQFDMIKASKNNHIPTEFEIKKIVSKYENLTFPFGD